MNVHNRVGYATTTGEIEIIDYIEINAGIANSQKDWVCRRYIVPNNGIETVFFTLDRRTEHWRPGVILVLTIISSLHLVFCFFFVQLTSTESYFSGIKSRVSFVIGESRHLIFPFSNFVQENTSLHFQSR